MSKTKKGAKHVKVVPKKATRIKKRHGKVAKQKEIVKDQTKPAALGDVLLQNTFILGEKLNSVAKKELLGGKWDFQHMMTVLNEYPDSDAYVFQQPEMPMVNGVQKRIPVMQILMVPRDEKPPPELLAIQNNQAATETIVPMCSLNLSWKALDRKMTGDFGGTIFLLQCSCRNTKTAMAAMGEERLYCYEYAVPWTMKPSTDWVTEANDENKLSVRFANFEYHLPGGEVIHEEFDRDDTNLAAFIPDFLERYDLPPEEAGDVKKAIQNGFAEKRAAKHAQKALLDSDYNAAALDAIKMVKVYPANDYIAQEHKSSYANKYYGHAVRTFPTDAKELA